MTPADPQIRFPTVLSAYSARMFRETVDWVRETRRALDEADFIAFFMSKYSMKPAGWGRRELESFLHRQVSGESRAKVIPVLLDPVPVGDIPPLLRDMQWIDLATGETGKAASALAAVVRASANSQGVA